jgi:hypothetical protein
MFCVTVIKRVRLCSQCPWSLHVLYKCLLFDFVTLIYGWFMGPDHTNSTCRVTFKVNNFCLLPVLMYPPMTFHIWKLREKVSNISNRNSSISIVISCELDNLDSVPGRGKNFPFCFADHSLLSMGSGGSFPRNKGNQNLTLTVHLHLMFGAIPPHSNTCIIKYKMPFSKCSCELQK